MGGKYEVTFQGAQGSVARVTDLRGNVAVVKFTNRRAKRLFPGQFAGVLVKANQKEATHV